MRTLFLAFFFSLSSAYAQGQFLSCGDSRIPALHDAAVGLINNTSFTIDRGDRDILERGLREYFKLSLDNEADKGLIAKVFANIQKVSKNANATVYKCHIERTGLWCRKNIIAIVPPPKDKVHLCPSFFITGSSEYKVGVVIHEWFHRWGGKAINYLPERYCYQTDGLPASQLIQNADQYMLFIHFIGTGGERLGCG